MPASPLLTELGQLLITLTIVPASLRYIERLWGSIETLKFIVVVVGLSNLIAFGFNWLEFLGTGSLVFLCVFVL